MKKIALIFILIQLRVGMYFLCFWGLWAKDQSDTGPCTVWLRREASCTARTSGSNGLLSALAGEADAAWSWADSDLQWGPGSHRCTLLPAVLRACMTHVHSRE